MKGKETKKEIDGESLLIRNWSERTTERERGIERDRWRKLTYKKLVGEDEHVGHELCILRLVQ